MEDDESGEFSVTVRIPEDIPAGDYMLRALNSDGDVLAEAPLTVTESAQDEPTGAPTVEAAQRPVHRLERVLADDEAPVKSNRGLVGVGAGSTVQSRAALPKFRNWGPTGQTSSARSGLTRRTPERLCGSVAEQVPLSESAVVLGCSAAGQGLPRRAAEPESQQRCVRGRVRKPTLPRAASSVRRCWWQWGSGSGIGSGSGTRWDSHSGRCYWQRT